MTKQNIHGRYFNGNSARIITDDLTYIIKENWKVSQKKNQSYSDHGKETCVEENKGWTQILVRKFTLSFKIIIINDKKCKNNKLFTRIMKNEYK